MIDKVKYNGKRKENKKEIVWADKYIKNEMEYFLFL